MIKMQKPDDMTCTDAVKQLLSVWPVGTQKFCWQIESEVKGILLRSGSKNHPTGASIMRRFHENRDASNIVCNSHGKGSFFVKTK
jgi:hypothetical protein